MTDTLTVDTADFVGLMTDALCTASTDHILPMLACVHLHVDSGLLVATSTDRYVAAQGHMAVSGSLPRTMVMEDDLRKALSILRALGKARGAALNVTRIGQALQLAQEPLAGMPTATVTLPVLHGSFPAVAELMEPDAADAPVGRTVGWAHMGRIAKVAARRKEAMQLTFGKKRIGVQVGESYRAVIATTKEQPALCPIFRLPIETSESEAAA